MNIIDAAYDVGHSYPGGMDSLAPRLGMNPRVLNSKLNPACQTHHLTMMESFRMQQMTGRADILHAEADGLGYVCIKRPENIDEDVSTLLADYCGESGDYLREVAKALHDNKITPNEAKRLQKELLELISAATALNCKLSAMVGA